MALEAAFELPELSRPRDGGALFTTNKLQFTPLRAMLQYDSNREGGGVEQQRAMPVAGEGVVCLSSHLTTLLLNEVGQCHHKLLQRFPLIQTGKLPQTRGENTRADTAPSSTCSLGLTARIKDMHERDEPSAGALLAPLK